MIDMPLSHAEWSERYHKLLAQINHKELAIARALFSSSRGAYGLSSAKKVAAIASDLVGLESRMVQLVEDAPE